MYRIRFQTAVGVWTFDEPRNLRIGRASDADITLDNPSISSQHAELWTSDQGWKLHDAGSRNGTWVNDQRVGDIALGPSTAVRFGPPQHGVEAVITVEQLASSPDLPEPEQPSGERTTMVYKLSESAAPAGGGILVRARSGNLRFGAGTMVRIGRAADLEVVADDPLVSRNHAMLQHRPDGWWYADSSRSGSYIDGEQVTEKKITQPTEVHLGHPTAGYELELVPMVDIASAQRDLAAKRRRTMAIRWAAIIGVLALVGAGVTAAVLLSGRGGQPDTLTAAELDRAKRASVKIIAAGEDGKPLKKGGWTGSGTIISSDGLVLTNAHVADPNAQGQDDPMDDAPMYLIALAKDDASPAEPKYRATPIVSDGYLDLAVVKINAKADGSAIDPGQLGLPEPLPIGDSNALKTGDRITALGFPALTGAGPLTITSGDVASFESDKLTKTDRFWIDSTERLGSGNSGGASINNAGEIIGVNSAVVTADTSKGQMGQFTSGSSLVRPIALANDVIQIARKGGDPEYVSPYLNKLPHLTADATAKSGGWGKSSSPDCSSTSTEEQPQALEQVAVGDTINAYFLVAGVPDGTMTTLSFVADDAKTVLSQRQIEWTLGTGKKCIGAELTVVAGQKGAYAVLNIGVRNELSVVNPVKFASS